MKRLFKVIVVLSMLGATLVASAAATAAPKPKTVVCHVTGNGKVMPIEVAAQAVPAHLAHGDGLVGEAIADMEGYEYDQSCTPVFTDSDGDAQCVAGGTRSIDAAPMWPLSAGDALFAVAAYDNVGPGWTGTNNGVAWWETSLTNVTSITYTFEMANDHAGTVFGLLDSAGNQIAHSHTNAPNIITYGGLVNSPYYPWGEHSASITFTFDAPVTGTYYFAANAHGIIDRMWNLAFTCE